MRTQAGYLLAATIAIGMIAAASVDTTQAQDKTIKIGGLLPMSGPGAYFGAQDKQGVDLRSNSSTRRA